MTKFGSTVELPKGADFTVTAGWMLLLAKQLWHAWHRALQALPAAGRRAHRYPGREWMTWLPDKSIAFFMSGFLGLYALGRQSINLSLTCLTTSQPMSSDSTANRNRH
jgi:hypothetical protein